MDEDSFALCQPLVDLSEGTVSKFFDGKRLDKEVEDYFLEQVIVQLQAFGECYGPSACVKVAVPLLPVFTKLAPRPGELVEGEDLKYKGKPVSAGFERVGDVYVETDDGSRIPAHFLDFTGFSWTGEVFKHKDGTFLKPHQAVDVRGYISDAMGWKLSRSIFVLNGFADWRAALFQALYHGSKAAMENVDSGCFKKIYVGGMGIDWLGCAEIDPIGFLMLTDQNSISGAGVKKLKSQVKAKCDILRSKKRARKEKQVTELEAEYLKKTDKELLKSLTERMKRKMDSAAFQLSGQSNALQMPYFKQERKVLVATATYTQEILKMQQFPLVRGSIDGQALMGIARIIYGDRILKWKLPALLALAAKRDDEARAEAKALMDQRRC